MSDYSYNGTKYQDLSGSDAYDKLYDTYAKEFSDKLDDFDMMILSHGNGNDDSVSWKW